MGMAVTDPQPAGAGTVLDLHVVVRRIRMRVHKGVFASLLLRWLNSKLLHWPNLLFFGFLHWTLMAQWI